MSKIKTMGASPLTGTIYYGTLNFIIRPRFHQHVIVTTMRMIYTWSK